ncbi:MAG: alpha/beta hydrolase [Spirochaetes bacterium]|nr:alpha/beta hydrolase [Spirochaetota bacterium]
MLLLKKNSVMFLMIIILLAACNSIFYYPSRTDYKRKITQPYEEITILSKSGNKLNGWYFKSQQKKSKGLFVFFHGNARNITVHWRSFSWITEAGYDYFLFDYSGYGKSTGVAGARNIYYDGISALDYIIPLHKDIPDYKIIISAMSLGGAVMLTSAAECSYKDSIDLLFVDCTFPSYKKIAKYHYGNSCMPLKILPPFFISDRYAPEKHLDQIADIPLLMSHCYEDEVIPYFLGEDLYSQLKNPKTFWKLSCKHTAGYWRKENQTKLIDFLETVKIRH